MSEESKTEIFYDFHIHTCLSPCGSDEMTPRMIVDCALAKELDCIAITDHNISSNCLSAIEYAEDKDIIVFPGMELQTSEEIHVVCIFKEIEDSLRFAEYVKTRLPGIDNNPDVFGHQTCVLPDESTYEEKQMLLISSDIPLYGLYGLVESYGGIAIPAHIDRTSFSVSSVLGTLDKDMGFPLVEVWRDPTLADKAGIPYIQSSDSHNIDTFFEAEYHSFYSPQKTPDAIFDSLKNMGNK